MKTKRYDVYYAGGAKITSIYASCISNACKQFIENKNLKAKFLLDSKQQAKIRNAENYSFMSDYVVTEV